MIKLFLVGEIFARFFCFFDQLSKTVRLASFVFGRNIRDVFAYAKVMLLTSFVMMLLPLVAMM